MSNPAGPEVVVVDSVDPIDRIDYHKPGGAERAVPYHCPYCAEEDLRPLGATPGAWHCRACTRTFSVRYLGMQPLAPSWPPTSGADPDAIPTGGSR